MSKSPATSTTMTTAIVGFGDNYYRCMGSATQVHLPHGSDSDGGVSNQESDNNKALHSMTTTTTDVVRAYEFRPNQGGEVPPWEQENDPLVDVQCTVTGSVFLTASGKVYTCGTLHGQVRPNLVRTIIALPLKCVQLAAGRHFCLARMDGGLAVCAWGAGHFGQLGLGNDSLPFIDHPTVIERLLPHVVGAPVTSIAAGYWHSMALTKAGDVYGWGCNRNSQCGMKPPKDPPTVCTPQKVRFDPPQSNENGMTGTSGGNNNVKIEKIAAGRSHSVAIDDGGQVYCWGACQYGQCGLLHRRRGGVAPPKHVEALAKVKIVDVTAGDAHTLALTGGGRVFGWGAGYEGQLGTGSIVQMNPKPKLVGDLDFVAIEAGREWKIKQKTQHGGGGSTMDEKGSQAADAAASASAASIAAASSAHAQSLASIPRIVSVTAKGNSSFAISSSGHVYAWGCNDVGNLGLPKPDPATLTYVDPGLPITKTSTLRQFQTYSFDSSHNVALPQRLDSIRHIRVKTIGVSPTFLWCLGTKRQENDDPTSAVGRTLYEIQEGKRQKSLHHAQVIRSMESSGSGGGVGGSSLQNSTTSFTTDIPLLQNQEEQPLLPRDPPEMKDGTAVDGESGILVGTASGVTATTIATAAAAVPMNVEQDDDDDDSSEGSTSHHSATIDNVGATATTTETPRSNTLPSVTPPKPIPTSVAMSASPITPTKKKRLFSPKKLVKAIVRRASGGPRADDGAVTAQLGSEKKGK